VANQPHLPQEPQQEEKRIGANPILVIFGVIFGLWLFVTLIIPKSKDIPPRPENAPQKHQLSKMANISSEDVPIFTLSATVPPLNALCLLVPSETTDSQVIALLQYLRQQRRTGSLATIFPPTTPADENGDFAIANLYVFSDPHYGVAEAVRALGRGAHAPGEFYPTSMTYEDAMEHVRGQYTINLYNHTRPETASLGFGEEATGVYSKRYQPIF